MIPLSDDNPTRTTPYVVYLLIALNVLVFAIDRVGAVGPFGNLWNLSMVPYSVIHNAPVSELIPVRDGAIIRAIRVEHTGLNPQWLTVFTSMFMHGGLLHIGSNMLFLWIFGNNIEDALGHAKFLVIYLFWGVMAAFAQIASDPNSTTPMVGASGAIAGVLGAYLVLYPNARVRTLVPFGFFLEFVELPAILMLGIWFLTQFLGLGASGSQVGGGVAYWAHIGGFVAGLVTIVLLGGRKRLVRRGLLQRYEDNDLRYF